MPKAVLDEVVSLQPYRVALENAIGIWTELPQATTYPRFTSRIAHAQKIMRVVSKIVPEKARSDPYRFCYTVFVTFNMIQAYGADFQDKFTDAFFEHVKKEQDFHFEDIKQRSTGLDAFDDDDLADANTNNFSFLLSNNSQSEQDRNRKRLAEIRYQTLMRNSREFLNNRENIISKEIEKSGEYWKEKFESKTWIDSTP
ncbi:unnamed protein product [Ambrosiozyma monospora]|uniref:Unnamed protein product n=1 Tax=Ambrosiozyma monospora TaxID=43982 RepID=A0A9W7DIJ0_AMBMO|nr:unnamed protein product [Ambrosiozyma monospora]